MKNKIYVLTEEGCPLVHAERQLDLFIWYKNRLKKLAGDIEDVVKLEGLLCQYEHEFSNAQKSEKFLDIDDEIHMILDTYEVNVFEIPHV